jgi:antitoxin FitA
MTQLTVRKLDDDARHRLEARAARNGRSLEAEARAILEEAASDEAVPTLRNDEEKGFGDLMYEAFKDVGLKEEEVRRFNGGIAEINSRWEMRIPDFAADDFEEADSSK